MHATIPKGIVGDFECTVFPRNFKEWHEKPWTYVCECQRKAIKVDSRATVSGKVHWSYPILPFGIVACTVFPTTFLEIAVFEFMINTAPLASNSVYGREKLFLYNKITFPNHLCNCGAVVKELRAPAEVLQINRVRLSATLFSVSLYYFFSVFFSFFNTIFPFGLFFFILSTDPAGQALGSILTFWGQVMSFILEKGFQKLLICILAKLTTR